MDIRNYSLNLYLRASQQPIVDWKLLLMMAGTYCTVLKLYWSASPWDFERSFFVVDHPNISQPMKGSIGSRG